MIREAKGIAIHDLSFWSSTLPLLDRFHRVVHHYQIEYGHPIAMQLNSKSGRQLHNQVLDRMMEHWHDARASSSRKRLDVLAKRLLAMMDEKETSGSPEINVPLSGCGIVIGGSCDILWPPYVIELKLTKTAPGVRDVRQVLVYVALLYLAEVANIEWGLVANPRLGVAVEFEVRELLLITGGFDLDEFATRLGQFLVIATQSN